MNTVTMSISLAEIRSIGKETSDTLFWHMKNGGLVARVASAVLEDLNRLCMFAKQHGVQKVVEAATLVDMRVVRAHRYRQDDPVFGGEYLGFGLGEGWLNLGFLQDPVIEEVKRCFEANKKAAENLEPSTYDTRCGSVTSTSSLYLTNSGCFELARTYCWFVYRRID